MKSKRLSRRMISAGACWVIAIGTILACDWTVDDDGPADFSDIQTALLVAIDGEVICVRCGVYRQNITVTRKVDLLGAGAKCTFLEWDDSVGVCTLGTFDEAPCDPNDAGDPCIVGGGVCAPASVVTYRDVEDGPNPTTFSGFTVRNGRSFRGGGMLLDESNPTITQNIISGNEAILNGVTFSGFGGGMYLRYSSSTISNNLVIGNSAEQNGGGISMYQAGYSPTVLVNNTIIGNVAARPGIMNIGYGGGIYVYMSDPIIGSNVIVGNTAEGGGGGIDLIVSASTIINDTDTFNNLPVEIAGTYTAGIGNVSVDPLFEDASNYCLRSNSPLIDVGSVAPFPHGTCRGGTCLDGRRCVIGEASETDCVNDGGVCNEEDFFRRDRIQDGDFDGTALIDMGYCESNEITGLMVDTSSFITWDTSVNVGAVFNLYRGLLSQLFAAGEYVRPPAGFFPDCDLLTPISSLPDTDVPALSEVFIYLVTGEDVVEGGLGYLPDGTERPNANPCP